MLIHKPQHTLQVFADHYSMNHFEQQHRDFAAYKSAQPVYIPHDHDNQD